MSFISDLPDEIIGQIFSHFIYDKCTLNQLALVCQQFYRVAQRSLVQHVELRDLTPEDEKSPQIRSNFGLFVRSVDENPGIAPMVREIKLSWNRERSRNHACANQLLGKLTSLRALSIVATRPKTERSFTKHEALSSVHLEDDLLNMSDVVPYMFLESMRHISIVYLQNPYTSEDYAAGSSRITSLNFGPDILLPESVLQKILRWPRALEQLTCHVPGYASQRHLPYFKQMKNPFSPYNIQVALAPALSSLVELTLLSDGTFWPAYDKTRLDLREFKTLQRVRVPSILFFDQAPISYSELLAKLESHNQLYKYLPQSLVELKIDYDHFSPVFFGGNLWFDIPLELEALWPSQLVWIAELARYKPHCFPNFQHLVVKAGESTRKHFKAIRLTEAHLSSIQDDLNRSGIAVELNVPKSNGKDIW